MQGRVAQDRLLTQVLGRAPRQITYYVYHSVAMLTAHPSLIKDESHPAWKSWLAHAACFCMAMSGSFDDANVLDLDRAIYVLRAPTPLLGG